MNPLLPCVCKRCIVIMRRYSQGQGKALPYGIDSDPPKDALEGGPGADGKSGGPVKGVSLLLSVFNLTNTAIGAGVLSLPFFFASTGVVIGELASYSSIIPFIHPVYTFIAVYAPMHTRYTCIYTMYTPLNT